MLRLLENLARDLRYGARMLRKRPGFTAVAVLSLAIGIGANTAIFTLVNTIIFRADLDIVDRPDQLMDIFMNRPDSGFMSEFTPIDYPSVEDLRDATAGVFSGFAEATFFPVQIDRGGGVEGVFAEVITGDYFPTIGVEAALGRTIGPQDDIAPGGHPVVMLSYGYWQRGFGRDPDIVGRELRVNGRVYTIVGVAPADYPGSGRWIETVLYAPASMADELTGTAVRDNRGQLGWWGKARLAPGVTRAEAEVAVAAVSALDEARPAGWNVGARFRLVPTTEVLFTPVLDPYFRSAAWLLMGVVGLVLLLACTNLASFLLARARDRRREVAVRLALGASRSVLVRQFLTETTLLGVLGGGVGLGLAIWLLRILVNADLPLPMPATLHLDLDLDANVLAFTGGIAVLAGMALGLVPALQTTRPNVVTTLKDESAGGGQPGQIRWRNALIVTQLTMSLVLLVGAGLFLRNFQQVLAVDPGFGREPAALMTTFFPPNRYTRDATQQLVRQLLDRFRALPGVDAVGVTARMPLSMMDGGVIGFNVDGYDPPVEEDAFTAEWAAVDPAFFDAAGIPIVRGRPFIDTDGLDGARVAIVSETMARRFWPNGGAVGRVLRDPDPDDADLRVIGVAGDISVSLFSEASDLMVYEPYAGRNNRQLTFLARTSADPEQTALALLAAGRETQPELMVLDTKTMARHLEGSRLAAQLAAFLLTAFAVLALVLSVVGLYGVVSYAVASRTREVGIRIALGASAAAITRLLTANGVRLVLVGSAIGLTLSLLATRVLSGILFGIETLDLFTFVAAPLVLLATAVVASYLPARRASRADPVTALRAE